MTARILKNLKGWGGHEPVIHCPPQKAQNHIQVGCMKNKYKNPNITHSSPRQQTHWTRPRRIFKNTQNFTPKWERYFKMSSAPCVNQHLWCLVFKDQIIQQKKNCVHRKTPTFSPHFLRLFTSQFKVRAFATLQASWQSPVQFILQLWLQNTKFVSCSGSLL